MCFVEDQDVIETFSSDGAYPSLSKGIGIGCLVRGANDMQTFRSKHCIKFICKLGVIVMDQEMKFILPVFHLPDQLPGLLRRPRSIRIRCDTRNVYTACAQFNEEEHIQCLQLNGFYC
jgi:hypothetical protein